jgi:hypothetical protein
LASDTPDAGGAIDPEDALQLFLSEGPEPQPAEQRAAPAASMPAEVVGEPLCEAEMLSAAWPRPLVSRRAWTLALVFALGCFTSFGAIRLFNRSSVEVRQAQTLAVPVEVPRRVLPNTPIDRTESRAAANDRTESRAAAKPARLAEPAHSLVPRAAVPSGSTRRPAVRSSAPQAVEIANGPVGRRVAIERDVPAVSGLSTSLSPSDDEKPASEPSSSDQPGAGGVALAFETTTGPPAAPVNEPGAGETTTGAPPAPVIPTTAIESVLKNYADAFSARDVGAAKSVWPGVDERALARAFDGLREQRLELERCEISIKGSAATATCVGTARYRPKVGIRSVRSERKVWTFYIGHRGAWVIDDVEVR